MKRDGCLTDTPSLSTTFHPVAAASRRSSAIWSGRRFISSTYNMFWFASASIPGSKASIPYFIALSTSRLPTTRSSVAPSGKSTTVISLSSTGRFSPFRYLSRHFGHIFVGSYGLQLKGHPLTTLILGRISANARTIVVFPEPLGPRINSPPILGFMAFIRMASLSFSRLTIAENGKVTLFCIEVFRP